MSVVPREATQPAADDLVSYAQFVERLQRLSESPRVRIQTVGRSHEGRGLHAIVIADEQAVGRLEAYRALAARLERPQVTHRTLADTRQEDRPAPPADMRYPALVVAHTFGHEAAHLEALLALAERLAWENDDEVQAILAKLIVVIYPLANPDGREAAIRHWRANRLGEDSKAAGNAYGFYINRDALHLTQPEGQGYARVFANWNPIFVYDAHEDAFLLGVTTPETCWAPAFGNAAGGEIPANLNAIAESLARAVLRAWDTRGYNYLRSDMFGYPMLGQSTDRPQWNWHGNVVMISGLHGVPAVITESARTPGSQPWEDRLTQKLLAGMAMLGETARRAGEIVDVIYNNAAAFITGAGSDAFIIPKGQVDRGALLKLVDTLIRQSLSVYETDDAYVVPLAQARGPVAVEMLSSDASRSNAMPPALGLDVWRLSEIPADQRGRYEQAALKRVTEAPAPQVVVSGSAAESGQTVIPNTPDGVRFLNRLWRLGLPVRWLTTSVSIDGQSVGPGAFVVENLPARTRETLSRGLALPLQTLPAQDSLPGRRLRAPRVAVYLGQGVDRPDSGPRAEMWYALERLEFAFIPLYGRQVRAEWLERADVLIVPDGDPSDIVHGWQASGRRSSDAWDLPGEPEGIGQEGLEAIRRFVEGGGAYVGIGSGGGLLATGAYAGLVEVEVARHSLGSGRVILQIADAGNPLTYSLGGYALENGQRQADQFAAFYYTESLAGNVGGPIFKTTGDAVPVAYYHHVDAHRNLPYVVQPESFDIREGGVAVATQTRGKGRATVIGVRPGFRGLWSHSLKLVTNAIFQQVAESE